MTLAPRLVRERFVFIKKMQSIQRMAPVQSKHPPLLTRQQGSRLARDLEARVAVPTTVTSKFHRDLQGMTHRDLPGMTHRDIPGMTQVSLHWSKLENGSYAKICIPKLQLYWYTGKKNSLTKIPQGVRGVRSGQTGVGVGPIHNYSFFSSALMCIAIRQSTV